MQLPSPEGVDALLADGYAPTMTASSVINTETGETVGYAGLKDSYGAPVTSKR